MLPDSETESRELVLPISGQPAVIIEGDGKSDRGLFKGNKPRYQITYEYLAALTQSIGDITKVDQQVIKDLLVPDQDFLAIEIFKVNYAETFEFSYFCGACGKTSDQAAPLNKLTMRPIPPESSGAPDPVITITLPRSGMKAEIGMLNGHKESIILGQMQTEGVDVNHSDYLCLRRLDGSEDFTYEDVVALKKKDHEAIRRARKQLVCGYDTFVIVPCPECGVRGRMNILTHPDFFYPGG